MPLSGWKAKENVTQRRKEILSTVVKKYLTIVYLVSEISQIEETSECFMYLLEHNANSINTYN